MLPGEEMRRGTVVMVRRAWGLSTESFERMRLEVRYSLRVFHDRIHSSTQLVQLARTKIATNRISHVSHMVRL